MGVDFWVKPIWGLGCRMLSLSRSSQSMSGMLKILCSFMGCLVTLGVASTSLSTANMSAPLLRLEAVGVVAKIGFIGDLEPLLTVFVVFSLDSRLYVESRSWSVS